jgi:hypothetical protein
MRKCVLLLPEIERNRVWEKKGFDDIYVYAAKLAGMGHDTVNESLRVLKKIEDKPELMKVVEEKGLAFARPIATIATKETAGFWAEKAKIMSVHTLETYVREIKKQENNQFKINDGESQNGLFMPKIDDIGRHVAAENAKFPQKKAILILVEPEVAEQLEKLKAQSDWNELMKEFLKLREEKLTAELKEIEQKEIKKILKKKKAVISKNELYKTKSRPTPTKIKKYVLHKTNHTCAFPGCTKPAENLHHVERFGLTGRHDPEKIIPLCKAHHDLAHDGLIENEDASPNEWRIGKKADITDYKILVDQRIAEYREAQKT